MRVLNPTARFNPRRPATSRGNRKIDIQRRGQVLLRARGVQAGAGFEDGAKRVQKEAKRVGKEFVNRAERTAAQVGDRVKESWQEVDSRYSVSTRLKHSRDDIERMLPHWRRKFREFSRSRAGRATLWAGFIYSIISGLLFQIISILFLAWWVVPLILIPFMRRNIAKAQEEGYGTQGRAGFGNNTQQGFGGFGGFGGNNRGQGTGQGAGQVIDAEWSSLDSEDSRRRR